MFLLLYYLSCIEENAEKTLSISEGISELTRNKKQTEAIIRELEAEIQRLTDQINIADEEHKTSINTLEEEITKIRNNLKEEIQAKKRAESEREQLRQKLSELSNIITKYKVNASREGILEFKTHLRNHLSTIASSQ